MKKRLLFPLCIFLLSGADTFAEGKAIESAEQAIAVATAVLSKSLSKSELDEQEPFMAVLKGGFWVIHGTAQPGPIRVVVVEKDRGHIVEISQYEKSRQ